MEFSLGKRLQRLVEDVGQTLGAHQRCPLHIRPIKHSNLLHSGDRGAVELRTREVAQGEYRFGRLRSHCALYFSEQSDDLLCAAVGQVDEEDLFALMGYKAN